MIAEKQDPHTCVESSHFCKPKPQLCTSSNLGRTCTVPSKIIGTVRQISLFLLFAEDIWVQDKKMSMRQ